MAERALLPAAPQIGDDCFDPLPKRANRGDQERIAAAKRTLGDRLVIDGHCPAHVRKSERGRRNVRLQTDGDVTVQAPAPGQDTVVRTDAKAGGELTVTVDGAGADVDLTCACVLTIVRKG